jgi:hypothetical protein
MAPSVVQCRRSILLLCCLLTACGRLSLLSGFVSWAWYPAPRTVSVCLVLSAIGFLRQSLMASSNPFVISSSCNPARMAVASLMGFLACANKIHLRIWWYNDSMGALMSHGLISSVRFRSKLSSVTIPDRICTVFVFRTVLTSQCILLYPSWAHYKALVKDMGTLQGTSKYFWHVDLIVSLQELRVTFWYCTAQYVSTGCNYMGSFVLLVAIAWDLLLY